MASCHFPTTPFQFGGWFKLQILHLSLFYKSVPLLSCIAAHTLNHSSIHPLGTQGECLLIASQFLCSLYLHGEKSLQSRYQILSVFCCCNETVISNMCSVFLLCTSHTCTYIVLYIEKCIETLITINKTYCIARKWSGSLLHCFFQAPSKT